MEDQLRLLESSELGVNQPKTVECLIVMGQMISEACWMNTNVHVARLHYIFENLFFTLVQTEPLRYAEQKRASFLKKSDIMLHSYRFFQWLYTRVSFQKHQIVFFSEDPQIYNPFPFRIKMENVPLRFCISIYMLQTRQVIFIKVNLVMATF